MKECLTQLANEYRIEFLNKKDSQEKEKRNRNSGSKARTEPSLEKPDTNKFKPIRLA